MNDNEIVIIQFRQTGEVVGVIQKGPLNLDDQAYVRLWCHKSGLSESAWPRYAARIFPVHNQAALLSYAVATQLLGR